MFCPQCGSELSTEAKFCYSCGAAIDRRIERSAEDQQFIPSEPQLNLKHRYLLIGCAAIGIIILIAFFTRTPFSISAKSEKIYQEATECLDSGNYRRAIELLTDLDDFKDASQKLNEAYYAYADELFEIEDYDSAYQYYAKVTGYSEAEKRIQAINCIPAAAIVSQNLEEQNSKEKITEYLLEYYDVNMKHESSYNVQEYTFYYRLYLTSFLDAVYGFGELIGANDEEPAETPETKEFAYSIYKMFYDMGFKDITCVTQGCRKDGTVVNSTRYTYEDYKQDMENSVLENSGKGNGETNNNPTSNNNTTDSSSSAVNEVDKLFLTNGEMADLTDYFNDIEHNGLLRFPHEGLSDRNIGKYLSCLFYDLSDDTSNVSDAELEELRNLNIDLEGDVYKLSTDYILNYLSENFGEDRNRAYGLLEYSFEQLGTYLSEYDAYYNTRYDTEWMPYTFDTGSWLDDDTVRLYYVSNVYVAAENGELDTLWDQPMYVDLKPRENGGWYIIRNCIDN